MKKIPLTEEEIIEQEEFWNVPAFLRHEWKERGIPDKDIRTLARIYNLSKRFLKNRNIGDFAMRYFSEAAKLKTIKGRKALRDIVYTLSY